MYYVLPRTAVVFVNSPVGLQSYTRQPLPFIDTTGEVSAAPPPQSVRQRNHVRVGEMNGGEQRENIRQRRLYIWDRDEGKGCGKDETDSMCKGEEQKM